MLLTGASSQSPVLRLRFRNDSDERMKHDEVWRRMKWREEYGLDRMQSMIINCVWKHNIGVSTKSPYVFLLLYTCTSLSINYPLQHCTGLYLAVMNQISTMFESILSTIHSSNTTTEYTTNKHYTCTITSSNSTLPAPSWKVETTWICVSTKCNNLIQCVLGWWWRM